MSATTAAAIARLAEQVRSAAAVGRPLCIRAGGTKSFYGNEVVGEPLDPRVHAGIVCYEPTELVVTARAGTALAELEAALDARGQMLAFEPPHFGATATVGGCVAAGLAGPRRAAVGCASGSIRDSLLGAKLLNGRAEVLSFGGTVMKNVAGYDVSRLLAGSLGTLGVVLEASIRVAPKPVLEETRRLALGPSAALARCGDWLRAPLAVSATCWHGDFLYIRLSGTATAVAAARRAIGGDSIDEPTSRTFWTGVREHTLPFFAAATRLWRIAVPPTAESLDLPGDELIEWAGGLRWLASTADAGAIRARAAALGGHATLFRGRLPGVGAFATLAPVLARLNARLRAEFDPAGIFNPGRMHADAPR
jgi:glycolate dehydrogenase FAD-binding subunit